MGISAIVIVLFSVLSCPRILAQPSLKGLVDYPEQPVTEGNWTHADNIRWMARNFSVKPSLVLPRGNSVFKLPYAFDNSLGQREFLLPGESQAITLSEALNRAFADAYIVIKDGTIIYERYFQRFTEHSHHSWFSGAKSMIGMALGILVDEGKINMEKTPADYLEPLNKSAFNQVSIRQTLNMTSALAYNDEPDALSPGHFQYEYYARAGMFPAYHVYTQAINKWMLSVPRGVRGIVPLVMPHPVNKPGIAFRYQNINVDVAGWLVESISGLPLHDFLRQYVWAKLGAEHDAFIPTDPNYTALAAGGLSSTLRDAARFGLAVLNNGKLEGETIFPSLWISNTYQYSDTEEKIFSNHLNGAGPDFSALGAIKAYKNYWYIYDREQGAMCTRGYAGQSIYINNEKNVVIAIFASAPAEKRVESSRLLHLNHLLANSL